jgi:ferredoxin
MPKLSIHNFGTFDVPAGKRLINCLVEEAATDQLHACGGNARCTTCRVRFIEGEPAQMTAAEAKVLHERQLSESGIRLSCQILCDHDMTVELISRLEGSGRKDQGSKPDAQMQPLPVEWKTRE